MPFSSADKSTELFENSSINILPFKSETDNRPMRLTSHSIVTIPEVGLGKTESPTNRLAKITHISVSNKK